jgi:hypothetical protein
MPRIDVRAQAHASPQQVWTVLTDTASWADWAPFDEVAVEEGHESERSAAFGRGASRPVSASWVSNLRDATPMRSSLGSRSGITSPRSWSHHFPGTARRFVGRHGSGPRSLARDGC